MTCLNTRLEPQFLSKTLLFQGKKATEYVPMQGLIQGMDLKFPTITLSDRGGRLVFKNVCLFVLTLQRKIFLFLY